MNVDINLCGMATVPGEILPGSSQFVFKVRMSWPDTIPMDDFKVKPFGPERIPPPDPSNPIGFHCYQASPPHKTISFSTPTHRYWCSLESMEGNVLTLSPHMAANIKAMERLVLPK